MKRNFRGFNRLAIICVCWWHTSSFDEGLCSLSALGFRLKLVAGVQFDSAIRRAEDCDLLLYRSGNGWICKNLIKRRRLQSKLQATVLWRELFIDQFWVSDCRCGLEEVEMSRACYASEGANFPTLTAAYKRRAVVSCVEPSAYGIAGLRLWGDTSFWYLGLRQVIWRSWCSKWVRLTDC
ncbi:MAG: hypothetical protein ACKERG_02790 [Candidatus Hodgkinia cicadicola]